MCRTDPSEFVRRAAVHFVTRCCSTTTMLIARLVTMCDAAACDVDCDVKCAAVRFWRLYLPDVQQSIAPTCCQTAVLAGSVSCLLSTVLDCDRAVRLETLKILVHVRKLAETHPALLLPAEHCKARVFFDDSSYDHICLNRDFVDAGLRRLPRSCDYALSASEIDCQGSTPAVNCDGASEDHLYGDVAYYSASVLTRLRATLLGKDWESVLASESQTSDDCHAGNPASLLDDILKTAHRGCNENDDGVDNESQDSVIIDCY